MPVIINGTTGLSGVSTVNLANGSVTQNILANGVAGTGPAFNAFTTVTQAVSAGTLTKVNFPSEQYDTANCFSSSRFTPNVAGYYFLSALIRNNSAATSANWWLEFWRNGTAYCRAQETNSTGTPATMVQMGGTQLMYLNGSTDYVEIYVLLANGGNVGGTQFEYTNNFQGFLARAA